MNHVADIQAWLRSTSLAGLIIPSTDEFISEFAPPANRRLRVVGALEAEITADGDNDFRFDLTP